MKRKQISTASHARTFPSVRDRRLRLLRDAGAMAWANLKIACLLRRTT
jgi:hypothetical protein